MELHCHLLGTVRRSTFEALARRENAPIPAADIEAFYTRGEKPVGVLRVLRALDAWLLKTPDDFHRLTYEYLEDAARHQVLYAEFFWNPTGTARVSGLAYPAVLAAVRRAIADAAQDFGITGRLVPAIDREADAAAALEMVQWVLQHRADEVPGIGIDYREELGPPERFVQAYAAARAAGLKATAHAGEFGLPAANVRTAIEQLQVDRIDHGYTIVDDPALARQAREAGLVFTVVPTNSYYLRTLAPQRWALDHPIRQMRALGLRVHPNTDDPTLHHVTPTGAWRMMLRDFGYSIDDLRHCLLNGLDAAWIDEGTRRRWRTEFCERFDALRQQWLPPAPA
ncbi:MAG TPA: adenosine deaminase [Aquabacterium sp.]|nr:adenosine deaminase [Aquabacterium sp.]HSW04810.1 adenosine deaminase [Aquabacterium sp.]